MRLYGHLARQGFLIIFCLVSLYPIWFILQTALKTNQQFLLNSVGFPLEPTLGSFAHAVTDLPVPRWMLNSVIVTLSADVASTIIALLASYALVFGRIRGVQWLINANVALMMVPPVALLIPLFILMVDVHLINTLPSVIIFYTGLLVPFGVFFLTNFLRTTMPRELIEAAKVDGLSPFRILIRIVVPMSAAAVFTLMLVSAINAWNELLIALVFLQNENARTLMAGLALFQGRYLTNQPLVMAGAFVSILPILLAYVFGQRFFVRGVTAGIGH